MCKACLYRGVFPAMTVLWAGILPGISRSEEPKRVSLVDSEKDLSTWRPDAGKWQTFDVIFRAPRFGPDGEKTANARFVKVLHNGVLVHENVEVTGPTRAAAYSDEKPAGPLMLQGDHGPVAYRNVRVRPLGPND